MNFKKLFLKLSSKYDPQIRKSKYTHSYYLDQIILLFTHLSSWRSLKAVKIKSHYTSVYKKFRKWTQLDLFNKTYKMMIKKNIKFGDTCNLLIDSSIINNFNGSELTQKKYYDRKHKATKLSVITSQKGIPLVAECYKCNEHDTKTVKSGIIKIKNNYKIKNINLIGDKGYIMKKNNKKFIKNTYKTTIITPYRKNQKNKNSKKEKKLLSKRYSVEHVFAKIKVFKRIYMRQERKISTFLSFVYLSFLIKFFK